MIQLIYEFDGRVAFEVQDYRVTGAQVLHEGRFFQILEGPEHAVMAAFERLSTEVSQLARIAIARRDFPRWDADTFAIGGLPDVVANRLRAFAALGGGAGFSMPGRGAAAITADRAISVLGRPAPAAPAASPQDGRVVSRIERRSDNRSRVAV